MKKLPLWMKIGVALAGLAIVAAILAIPAINISRDLMYERLMTETREQADAGNLQAAYQEALRTTQLFPDDVEAKLELARIATDYLHPLTPQYWEAVIDAPERTPEDLKDFVLYLFNSFQIETARRYLVRLYEELPEDGEVQEIYVQSLLQNQNYQAVLDLLASWNEAGRELDLFYFESLYTAMWGMNTEESRAATFRILQQNARRMDEIGADATRRLLALGTYRDEDLSTLGTLLVENPASRNVDFLQGLGILATTRDLPESEVNRRIRERFDLESTEDLRVLARWLYNRGDYEAVLSLTDRNSFFQDPALSNIYHLALLESGRADEAYENTIQADIDNGLEPVQNLIIRARAQLARGQMEEFDTTLGIAVDMTGLTEFSLLEEELFRQQAWTVVAELYEEVLDNPQLRQIGLQKMAWAEYLQGDEVGVLEYFEEMNLEDYTGEPAVLAFLVYLKILFQDDPLEARFYAERLIAQFPRIADFHIIQAFGFFIENEPDLAWILVQDHINDLMNQGSRFQKIILYLVASGSGYEGDLSGLRNELLQGTLLPSERRLLQAGS